MVPKKSNSQPAVEAGYISSCAYVSAVLVVKTGDGKKKNEAQGAIKKKTQEPEVACADSSLSNILLNSNTNSSKTR